MKIKRTGRSLVETINNASPKTMLTVGFTEAQAERVKRTRRSLPLVEDRKQPCIDAKKLWEKIGKPYGAFRKWAEQYIKPLLDQHEFSGEISPVKVAARGTPRTDYILSRDVAAHLAMMARTPEGYDVRRYFLDMEELALKLSSHFALRATLLSETDNAVANLCYKSAGDAVKAGHLSRGVLPSVAEQEAAAVKSIVSEALTGKPARYWRDLFKQGIRDVLNPKDLTIYASAYSTARVMLENKVVRDNDELLAFLTKSFGGKVDMDKYITKQVVA
jgi:anti-repressor protein